MTDQEKIDYCLEKISELITAVNDLTEVNRLQQEAIVNLIKGMR